MLETNLLACKQQKVFFNQIRFTKKEDGISKAHKKRIDKETPVKLSSIVETAIVNSLLTCRAFVPFS
jgi:hypothetical protein